MSVTTHFIEYYRGDIPLIFTAPHGGDVSPSTINDRTQGVFDQDDYTIELTKDIIEAFEARTTKRPYAVIATISRKKVDLNRKESEAYEDKRAKPIYDTFHGRIKEAESEVERRFGKGLYIDIHGQSHPKGYLEFGYLLVNDILKLDDEALQNYQEKTSIKTLSRFSTQPFLDQLKGAQSLGSLMCARGYDSVPSQKIPFAIDDNYFEGAFDTIRYGSLGGGNISGIQIEFPYEQVRDSKEHQKACANAFVESLIIFLEVHLGVKV